MSSKNTLYEQMDRFLMISLAGSLPAHLLHLKLVGGPGSASGSGNSGVGTLN